MARSRGSGDSDRRPGVDKPYVRGGINRDQETDNETFRVARTGACGALGPDHNNSKTNAFAPGWLIEIVAHLAFRKWFIAVFCF